MPSPFVEEAPVAITQAMKDVEAYHTIRMARADFRLFGIRQKNRPREGGEGVSVVARRWKKRGRIVGARGGERGLVALSLRFCVIWSSAQLCVRRFY